MTITMRLPACLVLVALTALATVWPTAVRAEPPLGCPGEIRDVLARPTAIPAPVPENFVWASQPPKEAAVTELIMRPVDNSVIKEAINGKSFKYVVDTNDNMWVYAGELDDSGKTLNVVRNAGAKMQKQPAFVVKEAGTLDYITETREIRVKPSYGMELAEKEMAQITKKLRKNAPGMLFLRNTDKAASRSQLIHCTQIINAQMAGRGFTLAGMISENAIATSILVVQEAMGANRLDTDKGRKILIADYVGGNIGVFAKFTIAKHLALKGLSTRAQLGIKLASGAGMLEMQRQLYLLMLEEEQKLAAEKLNRFNTAHFIARIPINNWIDNSLMNKLPARLFDACRRDSKAFIIFSPTMIRIYERTMSTFIYFGARALVTGQ